MQVLENRIFSEGLHILGQPPAPEQAMQYLSAYFGACGMGMEPFALTFWGKRRRMLRVEWAVLGHSLTLVLLNSVRHS